MAAMWWVGLLAVCLSLVAIPAPAQEPDPPTEAEIAERDRAKVLASAGMDLVKGGDIQKGIAKLEEALALVPVPTIALATADAMVTVGRLKDAVDMYGRASRLEVPDWVDGAARLKQQRAGELAAENLERLIDRVPKVRVVIVGRTAEAFAIDGEPQELARLDAELFLDPGVHVFEASAGELAARREVRLAEGDAIKVALALDRAQARPGAAPSDATSSDTAGSTSDASRLIGFIIIGAAGATLAGMVGTWAAARGLASDLDSSCVEGVCDPQALGSDGVDDLDTYGALRTATIGLGVASGVLATIGLTFVLTAPSDESAVSLWLAPTQGGLRARF